MALVAFVIVIGVYQATKATSNPVRTETKAAEALVGKCLAEDGTSGGHPVYKAAPVACGLPTASVKVVVVRPGAPGSPPCPADTTPVHLPAVGVRYPHVECVTPVAGG